MEDKLAEQLNIVIKFEMKTRHMCENWVLKTLELRTKIHFIADKPKAQPRCLEQLYSNSIWADVLKLVVLICKAKADPVKRSSSMDRLRIGIRNCRQQK
ncbi:unnamed protein product [Dovyalis caffra]|uniref:Uncharacterized protein n=1 Tax=Dovyalis caffra TaxID=77055 RepID=A0AAV1RYF1_9ROSI|nr:unnamed protein product [Dovyalis caffra]